MTPSELLTAFAALRRDYQTRRDQIMAQIADQLDELEAEVGAPLQAAEEQVRAAVLESGAKATGGGLVALVSQGRVTWNTKALDGYVVAHPELAQFRTTGQPFVTIRKEK